MFPGSTKGGGQCLANPDVCNVPTPGGPAPTPFPNMGDPTQAVSCCDNVTFDGCACIVKGSNCPMTSGDEAGTLGGASSGTFKGKMDYTQGSSCVTAGGKAVCHLTSMTAHNNNNIPPGQQIAPSQTKVTVRP
jgi:hypothetical protein